jgi:hypothetical protein
MKFSRRDFLKFSFFFGGSLIFHDLFLKKKVTAAKLTAKAKCTLYRAVNGTPKNNLEKIIDLMGGIEKVVEADDIVIIKPNLQWWNQGGPNLSALKTLVDIIMDYPGGFNGEVVIAENCHRGLTPWKSMESGWVHRFDWNSDINEILNMNDLSKCLKRCYGKRFSTCHWIDVDAGNKRVFNPEDGPGYVYCDGKSDVPLLSIDNGAHGAEYRAVILSYPIFRTDNGTLVDFRNGIWEKGGYTKQNLRFINFSGLNHHSVYCGVTGALKNYLGITDLSGGPDPYNGGRLVDDYCNFHSFPFDKWSPGPVPGMLGSEIGLFMSAVRKADLNITTAEWVGLSSRIELPAAKTRAILSCSDPVALDYHACKYILVPNSKLMIHDPENTKSPLHHYLKRCAQCDGGILDERFVAIRSFDFQTHSFQNDDQLFISGDKNWGSNLRNIMKYLFLKFTN